MPDVTPQSGRGLLYAKRGTMLLVLGLSCGVACWLASGPTRSPVATESLTVDQARLDFGQAWEDKTFRWDLPLRNPTAEDIHIVEFATSCGCLTVDPPSLVIPAGQTARPRLTIDLTRRTHRDGAAADRDFAVQVTPRFAHKSGTQPTWQIRGRVRSLLTVLPAQLFIQHTRTTSDAFSPRMVKITANAPLQSLLAKCDPAHATVDLHRSTSNNSEFQLEIVPSSTLFSGNFRFDVALLPIDSQGRNLPVSILPIEGRLSEDLHAVMPTVAFGARVRGDIAEETISIESTARNQFQVESIKVESGDTVLRPSRIQGVQGKTFRLAQRITALGHHSGKVEFHLRETTGRDVLLTISVSYYGLASANPKSSVSSCTLPRRSPLAPLHQPWFLCSTRFLILGFGCRAAHYIGLS